MDPLSASYSSDSASGEDSLAVSRDTQILARVVLSQYIEPPLSIGVFGEHGTGRSFFLKLLRRDLENQAGDGQLDLVNVPFNALLNIETNPWIALVDAIYRSLEETLLSRFPATPPAECDKLFEGLGGTALRLREQALARVENAASSYRQAVSAYRTARWRHKQNLKELAKKVSWQRWQDIEKNYWPDEVKAGRQSIKTDGKKIGVSNLDSRPEDLHNILDQAKSIEGIASIISASVTATPMLGTLTLFFLVVVMVFGLGGIAYLLKDFFPEAKGFIDAYGKTLGIIGTVFTAFGVLALVFLRNRARFALNRLRGFIDILRNAERDADREHNYDLALIEEDVAVSRETLADRRQQMQRTKHEYLVAKQEFAKFLEPGILRRVIEFYRNTLISESNLGASIVPILREDIDALTRWLMTGGAMQRSVGAAEVEGARQNRVVVYIDDFDRCPPEHVFTILQATNLLLSTPLFVVVMVMDPRMTMRAIKPSYEALMRDELLDETSDLTGTSALEYLARLIQIPFWLSRHKRAQIDSLVSGMMRPFEALDEQAEAASAAEAPKEALEPESKFEEEIEARPKFVDVDRIYSHDQYEFVKNLMMVVPLSPRTVKRFISLCRLAIAEIDTYDVYDENQFYAVATLLAIVVAFPLEAPRLFGALDKDHKTSLSTLVDEVQEGSRVPEDTLRGIDEMLDCYVQRVGADQARSLLRNARWLAARHSFNMPPPDRFSQRV